MGTPARTAHVELPRHATAAAITGEEDLADHRGSRHWIGIEGTNLAITLIKQRLPVLNHTPDVIAPSTPPTPPLTTRLLPVHLSYVRCAHSTVWTPDQPTGGSRQPTNESRPVGVDHNGDQKAVSVIRDDPRQSSRGGTRVRASSARLPACYRVFEAGPSFSGAHLRGPRLRFGAVAPWRWDLESAAYTSI